MTKQPTSTWSVRRQVGQTMMFGFHGTEPSPEIEALIRDHHVGGVILFARNIGRPEDVLRLTTALQRIAYEAGHAHPLFISIDQENGIVRRLGAGATLLPGSMAIGATGDPHSAFLVSEATGLELKALGINYNLAPVLDVNNNPGNPVIGVRSYGEDPHVVADYGIEAMRGLQAAGVPACGKHFPGHGDTSLDSHLTLPQIAHDRARLDAVELVPFMKAITAGIDSIMIAHVCFPTIEPDADIPATMSRRVVEGLLREELGFTGLVTTDCMEMHAISKTVGTVEGVYRAFQAGIDLSFISHTHEWQHGAIERLVAGIESGDIPQERLTQAVERIIALKEKYLSWDDLLPLFDQRELQAPALVGGAAHQELAQRVMEAAVTLTKNVGNLLPLALAPEQTVGVIGLINVSLSPVEDDRYLINPLVQAVAKVHPNYRAVELKNPPSDAEIAEALQAVAGCSAVLVGTMNAQLSPQQAQLVRALHQRSVPLVVVSLRTPYDLSAFPDVHVHVAAYEFTPAAADVAVQAIFGQRELRGRLPVTIPALSNCEQAAGEVSCANEPCQH